MSSPSKEKAAEYRENYRKHGTPGMNKYTCKVCGKPFYRWRCYEKSRGKPSTCSFRCAGKRKRGKRPWNYKGGKTTSRGYKATQTGNIGSRVYKFEHRIIMEKHIGRTLKTNEVVHHLNGIRDDNRIENLQLMTKQLHDLQGRTYVKLLQQRIRHLEKLLAF